MKTPGLTGRLLPAAVLACAMLTGSDAMAGKTAVSAYPLSIQTALHSGMKLIRQFPAVSGLTGWVLSHDGRYSMVFTTADRKTLILGTLVDEKGADLTSAYAAKYIPKPDYATLFPALKSTGYVVEGAGANAKSVLYVFFDPNCIYCHLTWKALQPYEKAGLQVRWIPVAFLKPTSAGKAAAIMEDKDPPAVFRDNELRFNTATEEGGIKPLGRPPAAVLARIQQNGQLMSRFGSNGTPTLVWKTKSGVVRAIFGLPKLDRLPSITGLPLQKIDDPELAKFH